MKYLDYKIKAEAIETKAEAIRAQANPLYKQREQLAAVVQRCWLLGPSPREKDHEILAHLRTWTNRPSLILTVQVGGHDLGSLPSHEGDWLSAAQWRVFADLVEAFEQWRAGALAEMPPSGPRK